MDATVFVRPLNTKEYTELGTRQFVTLPRVDEYISAGREGGKKYYQVFAIHHATDREGAIEIYAVESEPSWIIKKGRTIGFGS